MGFSVIIQHTKKGPGVKRSYECVELIFHSTVYLHDVVLLQVRGRATSQAEIERAKQKMLLK
jgi:hypothetical protein